VAASKPKVDLDALEKAYRDGVKPLRAIGADFGISEAVIRKYANKYGWSRDLSEKIKAKADEIVRVEIVRNRAQNQSCAHLREADIIKSAAELQAGALLQESEEIKRLSRIADKFESELERIPESPDADPADLEKRTRILKQLSEIREKIINLRRRNLNINDNSNGDADKKQPITNVSYTIIDPQRVDIQQAVVTNNAVIDGNTRT
jgi:hypothetical protein